VHVFAAGALLLAISGAGIFFAATWSAGPPPSNVTAGIQRWTLAVGVAVLVLARSLVWPAWTVVGSAGAVITALALWAVILLRIVAAAPQARFRPALRFYEAAAACGIAGSATGMAVALGWIPPDRWRPVHMELNLLGLVGLVLAGTLPFFAATEARVKMSPRATAKAQGFVLGAMAVGVAAAAFGLAGTSRPLSASGLACYALGVIGIVSMIPRLGAKQFRWAGPRLVQLLAGVAWWGCLSASAAVRAAAGEAPFAPPLPLVLVVGGYAQILAAALAYLGPVLRGGGHERLGGGFRVTRSWPGLIAANVAAVALLLDARPVAAAALGVWLVDTLVRVALLVAPARDG